MKKAISFVGWTFPKLIGLILLWGLFFPQATTASKDNPEMTETASATGFTYQVQLPENQLLPDAGYYDLLMTPGAQQTLSFTLNNPGEKAITVDLSLNAAKTNSNGVIEYNRPDIANDASLKFDFSQLVTGPESVELAAGESKSIELNVQMPETAFEGVIAGAITMQQANAAADEPIDEESGSYVNNKYAYAVVILLRESQTELVPELKFNQVAPGQQNFRNLVFVNLSNTTADYLYDMMIDAQVTAKDKQEVLWESRATSMRMAPNSFIDYPISMGGDAMVAGTYTAHVKAYVADLVWQWSEDFTITQEEANSYNERDVGLEQTLDFDWQLIFAIVGSFFVITVGLFLLVRHFRKSKERAKQIKRRQKKARKIRKKKGA
ncbi:DUF916 and DUF3324 domain-containing protein [Enterococcus sp. LJL120]